MVFSWCAWVVLVGWILLFMVGPAILPLLCLVKRELSVLPRVALSPLGSFLSLCLLTHTPSSRNFSTVPSSHLIPSKKGEQYRRRRAACEEMSDIGGISRWVQRRGDHYGRRRAVREERRRGRSRWVALMFPCTALLPAVNPPCSCSLMAADLFSLSLSRSPDLDPGQGAATPALRPERARRIGLICRDLTPSSVVDAENAG